MALPRGIKQRHPLNSLASRTGVSPLSVMATPSIASTGVKISELPAGSAANATDQMEVNQSGTSRRITLEQVSSLLSTSGGSFNLRDYGAVGDGITDDTLALQAAIDACNAAGGGIVNCTGGRWLIDSAILTVRGGVFLVGPWSNVGNAPGDSVTPIRDYSDTQSALIVNPTYTVRLAERGCGIQGMVILRKGMTVPGTLREGIDFAALFSGTAITVRSGDTWLSNLLILGFDYAIRSGDVVSNGRVHMEWITGDNNNGIYMIDSLDMQHLSHVHFWPFTVSGVGTAIYTVSGAVDNGSGLVRLTVSANVIQTGDRVTVRSVGGVTGATGAFIATVINPTTIDLQGSTFGGAYTSGGQVSLVAGYRPGVGIHFDSVTDWGQMDNCFAYNYAVGFKVNNSYPVTLVNCGADSFGAAFDPTLIGIWITGSTTRSAALIGCKTAAQGIGLKIDTSASINDHVQVTNHRWWGNLTYAVHMVDGAATFINCDSESVEVFRIDDAVSSVSFVGGDLTSTTFEYESSASVRPAVMMVRGLTTNHLKNDLMMGRLSTAMNILGNSSAVAPTFQIATTNPISIISAQRYSTSASGPIINMAKSQTSGVAGTHGIVADGEVLGFLTWNGSDGVRFIESAQIRGSVDGTPAVDSMPGMINFLVTPSGSIQPVEAMRVSSAGNVNVGTALTPIAKLQVRGAGQSVATVSTSTTLGATLYLQDTGAAAGAGGMVMFGASQGAFATVKGMIGSGSNNTAGDVVVSTRRVSTDSTLTETARFGFAGNTIFAGSLTSMATVTLGAGANTQAFVKASSTANLGLYYGTGAPSFSAAKGSLYTCTNATTTTTRLYVNTDGSTTWTNLTTAA